MDVLDACADAPNAAQLQHVTGISLPALLDGLDLRWANAARIRTFAGRTLILSLQRLYQSVLAYEDRHVVRLVVPGLVVCQHLPAVVSITVGMYANPHHDEHPLATRALFGHMPDVLSGIAIIGAQGLSGVELRADGGPWFPARIVSRTPLVAQWTADWMPYAPVHTLHVRARDAFGHPQPAAATHSLFTPPAQRYMARTVQMASRPDPWIS
jgi:hypothetical protein